MPPRSVRRSTIRLINSIWFAVNVFPTMNSPSASLAARHQMLQHLVHGIRVEEPPVDGLDFDPVRHGTVVVPLQRVPLARVLFRQLVVRDALALESGYKPGSVYHLVRGLTRRVRRRAGKVPERSARRPSRRSSVCSHFPGRPRGVACLTRGGDHPRKRRPCEHQPVANQDINPFSHLELYKRVLQKPTR